MAHVNQACIILESNIKITSKLTLYFLGTCVVHLPWHTVTVSPGNARVNASFLELATRVGSIPLVAR